jgi:protein TonB
MTTPRLDQTPLASDDSLLMAIFLAALLHVFILLGINFRTPEPPKVSKSIEVTVSHAPLKKAPKTAKYLAADHQLGAGEQTSKPQPLKQSLPVPQPIVASQPTVKAEIQTTVSPSLKKPTPQKLLTQTNAPVRLAIPRESIEDEPHLAPEESKPRLSAETLEQQIAQLGEQIRTSQKSAEDSKVKFVNSVSTHKYLAAQYVKDWEDKVERTGNLNYPEAARQSGHSQILTMDVGISADGSIYSMRITRSSGNSTLDEAAKRIVSMSAPFAELPQELLKELNVLVITRVWKFSDETGMTAR